MNRIGIIGAGAWGTALAMQAARAGNAVTLWARDPAQAAQIATTRRSARLPDTTLPPEVQLTADLASVDGDLLLLAVPMQHLREIAGRLRPPVALVACAKGVEQKTLHLPLEVLSELHPGLPTATLTGPNFAHEIAAGLPAAAVVASADAGLRASVIERMATPAFRLYGNDDPVGAQIGGAAKNVVAIAAGAVIGAELGENARAGLVTRGLAELARLAVALGGRAETITGLSGMGDLLLSCTSITSRNFAFGRALGQGTSVADLLAASATVIEGVWTAPALVARARAVGLDLPICAAVADLLVGRTTLQQAMANLLARPRRDE